MRIKEGYKIRNIAGESVIVAIGTLNVNLTKVISLNATSVWLWEQLHGKDFNTEEVARLLAENYDVDYELAVKDSVAWIDSMRQADLIEG